METTQVFVGCSLKPAANSIRGTFRAMASARKACEAAWGPTPWWGSRGLVCRYGGFHSHGGTPIDGFIHGKSQSKMDDDWGTPILGNLHIDTRVDRLIGYRYWWQI